MSVFNRSTAMDAWARGTALGRQIFVDSVGGNDTTGDGSRSFPYATISRGAQDLRTGQFDVLFIRRTGTSLVPSVQTRTIFTGLNDIAIVGMGTNWIGQASGAAGGMKTVTAMTIVGALLDVTTSAAHGYAVGDFVFFRGVAQSGNVRINGSARISTIVGANQFRCVPQNVGTLADQPYTGGALGNCQIAAFGFYACSNVLIYNLNFSGAVLSANAWTGIAFHSETNNPVGNVLISNCGISNASIGYNIPPDLDLDFSGANMQIERCRFSPSIITAVSPLCDFSQIYLGGGKTWVVNENTFASLVFGATHLYPGAIRHTAPPGVGMVIVNNQFDDTLPATARVFSDDPSDLVNVFYRRSFFAAGFTVPEQMDASGDVFDTEPAEFIGQDFLNTHSDLIWRQPTVTAIADPNSMGELVARTAFQGAVHIDTTGAGTAGTAFPIGTPEVPVSNIADARTIADAQGFRRYVLNGAVTVAVDHLNWSFEGVGDAGATVWTFANTCDMTGSSFFQSTVLGDLTGSGRASYQEALIGESGGTVLGLQGILNTVGLFGTIRPAAGGTIEGTEVASRDVIGGTILDYNGAAATIALANVQGIFSVVNNTSGLGVLALAMAGAILTLEASNTSGIYVLLGHGEVTDNKAGATSYSDNVLHGSSLHNVLNATASRAVLSTGTNPWREIRYVYDEENPGDSAVWEIYELYDQDGVALAGDENGGNNPLFDPTRLIAERRRV